MKGKIDTQTREDPGASFAMYWGPSSICVGCGRAQPYFDAGIDGGGRARACGLCAKGEGTGTRGMEALQDFLASGRGHAAQGNDGHALGVALEVSGCCDNGQIEIIGEGQSRSGAAQWQRGHRGMRASQIAPLAVDIPGGS